MSRGLFGAASGIGLASVLLVHYSWPWLDALIAGLALVNFCWALEPTKALHGRGREDA